MSDEPGTASPPGTVVQVSVSPGGVPKLPVAEALAGELGLAGDGHADGRNHGGPERAICLYSLEVIEALRGEGHNLFPGAAGENLTLAGIDWRTVVPGARLAVGESVLLEVTRYTTPCWKNAGWFRDGDFMQMSQDQHPGRSRVYAKVLVGGIVRPGDIVEVAAASAANRLARTQPRTVRWQPPA